MLGAIDQVLYFVLYLTIEVKVEDGDHHCYKIKDVQGID